ncbi:MAG: protease inhibitor I42 family protein [Methanoregulaceae archaeon]
MIITKRSLAIIAIGCTLLLAVGLIAGCTQISGEPKTTDISPDTTEASGSSAAVPVQSVIPTVTVETPATVSVSETNAAVPTVFVNNTLDGKIVTIPLGERVLVRLPENPTTGYSWNASIPDNLDVLYNNYTASDSTLIGSGGYHEWILSPKTVDTYSFKAVYFRPWEAAEPTDETFTLVIAVTPQ